MTTNEEKKDDLQEAIEEEKDQEQEEQEQETEDTEETAEEAAGETEDAADEAEDSEGSEEDEELQAKYVRLMADFQNFKKRAERDRGEIYARANESIVTELLDVADNFERALAEDSASADENFLKGMTLIFDQLSAVLERFGVKEIESEGEEFDPNFHNAVMMEDTDKVESGKVSVVLQKGYTLNGRVIRPAMVKVAN